MNPYCRLDLIIYLPTPPYEQDATPGQMWPGVVAPDKVQSIGQIELNCVLMII